MNVLGLSFYYHDSSAALVQDGVLVAAAEEERFSRTKHDSGFPALAIDFCLKTGRHHDRRRRLRRLLREAVRQVRAHAAHGDEHLPALARGVPRVDAALDLRQALDQVDDAEGARDPGLASSCSPTTTCRTRRRASSRSPFEEAAILTVDGAGEWTTATMGVGRGTKIEILKEMRFPHSLGLLYSAFTAYCGFEVNEGEYKLMGMHPYGKPTLRRQDLRADRRRRGRLAVARHALLRLPLLARHDAARRPSASTSAGRRATRSSATRRSTPSTATWPRRIQKVTEEIVLKMARHLHADHRR